MLNTPKTPHEIDYETLLHAFKKIAYGRVDNGRPLGGPTSMSIAREALSKVGIDWSKAGRAARGEL